MRRGRKCLRTGFLCFSCLTLTSIAAAHDSEPINTEFASPLAMRTANLNFDFQHFGGSPNETFAALGVEYGIARRMQLSVDLPPLVRAAARGGSVIGMGNLSLAHRYLIAGGNERPFAVSVDPEAEFPTGNPGVADPAYLAGASVHVDAHRGEKLRLHSNLGCEAAVANFVHKDKDFDFAVAGMYELTEKWHPVGELFGHHDFNGAATEMSVAPEVIYSVAEHWEIKVAVPLGTTSSTPAVGVQFNRWWSERSCAVRAVRASACVNVSQSLLSVTQPISAAAKR